MALKQFIRKADMARLMGVGDKTAGRWAAKRGIRAFETPGGRVRYRVVDVVPLLDELGCVVPLGLREAARELARNGA